MPARVAARVELEGVRVFLDATKTSEKAFAILGASAIAAAATVTAAMAGLVTAVSALGGVAIKSAAKFETQMNTVRAVGDMSSEATAQLSRQILKLSQNYDYSADEIAQAAAEIQKAGVDLGDFSEEVLKASLNLAVLTKGEMSTGKAATFVAGTMTAWGIKASEVARISNALAIAANSSAVSVNDLIRSLQQVTAVADFAGFEFEDTVAVLAIMGQEYMRNSDAGTSMKQMMLRLISPTKQAKELLNKYNINLSDVYGNTRPLPDIIEDLDKALGLQAQALGKVTEQERLNALATIFGSDAVRSAAIVAMAGVSNYQKMRAEIQGSTTSADKMAKMIQDGLLPTLGKFKNILVSFATSAGMPVVEAIGRAFKDLNEELKKLDLGKFETLGRYIVDIATTGKGAGDAIKAAFGPDVASVIEGIAKIFTNFRDVMEKEVVPGLFSLKQALLGEKSTTASLGDALNSLADTVTIVGTGFGNFLTAVALIIQEVPKARTKIDELTQSFQKLREEMQKNTTLMRILEAVAITVAIVVATRAVIGFATSLVSLAIRFAGLIKWIGGFIFSLGGIIPAIGQLAGKLNVLYAVFEPILAIIGRFGGAILGLIGYTARWIKFTFAGLAGIDAGWQFLVRSFSTVGPALQFIGRAFAGVASVIANAFNGVKLLGFIGYLRVLVGWVGTLGTAFGALFTAIRTGAAAAFAAIVGGSGGTALIIIAIIAALAALIIFWPQISAAVAEFVKNAQTFLGNLWQSIVQLASNISTTLQSIWQPIADGLTAIWNYISPILEAIAYAIGIVLVVAIAVVVVALVGLYKIVEMVFNLFILLGTEIYKLGQAAMPYLNAAIAAVVGAVNQAIEIIRLLLQRLAAFQAGIISSLGGTLSRIWAVVGPILLEIGKIILSIVAGPIVGFVQGIIALGSIVGRIMPGVRDILKNVFQSVLGFVLKFLGIAAAVDPAMESVRLAAQQAYDGITGTIDNAADGITKGIQDAAKQTSDFLNGLVTGAEKTYKDIEKGVTDTANTIKTEIESAVSTAASNFEYLGDVGVNNLEAIRRKAREAAEATALIATSAAASGQDIPQLPREVSGPRKEGGNPPGTYGGGGGEDADKWLKFFKEALKALPLMNKELAEFLAGLAKEAPERAQPMVDALMSQVGLIKQMAVEKAKLIAIDIQILKIDQNIRRAQIELNQVNLKMKEIELRYAFQILALQNELLAVQYRIAEVQQEINKIQQGNIALAREKIQIETEIFDEVQQIERIDREINKLGRVNRQLELDKAQAYLDVLPALQEQERLERAIEKVHDRRLELLNEEQQIQLKITQTVVDRQLRQVNRDLEKAWAAVDVPKILQLDKQRFNLEVEQGDIQGKLDDLQSELDLQTLLEDQVVNRLEQEKLGVDAVVESYKDKMLLLDQQEEREKAIAAVKIAQLELEKQKIEDTIQPMRDRLFAIEQEQAAEAQRNALRLFDLQQELISLQFLAGQLQLNIQKLQLQMAQEQAQYAARAIQLEQYINEEEQKRAQLEADRLKQEEVFGELVEWFLKSMKQSGAFSEAEAIEVAKRLGLWDDSIDRLASLKGEYDKIIQAVKDFGTEVNNLPTYHLITVEVHTIHTNDGGGDATGAGANASAGGSALAAGGIAQAGQVYLVGENGPEIFVPNYSGTVFPNSTISNYDAMVGGSSAFNQLIEIMTNTNSILYGIWTDIRAESADPTRRFVPPNPGEMHTTEVNYNVDAHYTNSQSPASIALDLRAMQMMANR